VVTTQKRVAQMYFDDGSIAQACPPLQALLHVMREDAWDGKGLADPVVRDLFAREAVLSSDWYAARLRAKQEVDRRLWRRHVDYLERFLKKASHADEATRLGIASRLAKARTTLTAVDSSAYPVELLGTLGAEPIESYVAASPKSQISNLKFQI
jgi:hypothetical protein